MNGSSKREPKPRLFEKRHKWTARHIPMPGRIPAAGRFEPRLAARLREECLRYDVSPPVVITKALALYLNVPVEEEY